MVVLPVGYPCITAAHLCVSVSSHEWRHTGMVFVQCGTEVQSPGQEARSVVPLTVWSSEFK